MLVERNWALLSLGRNDEVQAILDRVAPTDLIGDLELQEAVVELRKQKYGAARSGAERVLRLNPDDVRAAAVIMQSYDAAGQTKSGLERLSEIADARPQSAPIHYLLGQWYLSAANTVAARKAFDGAKSANSAFLQADLSLAEIDRREHRLDAAWQRLVALVAAHPNDTPSLLELADIERERGDRPAALAGYRSVLAEDDSNVQALTSLAFLLAEDDPDAALNLAQKAGELAPNNVNVQDSLGRVYYRKGLYKAAVNYLQSAAAQAPTPLRQFHLAMAYLKSGDRSQGEKLLVAALQKDSSLKIGEHGW